MTDQFYSFFCQVNEQGDNIIKGWEKHFLWLEDVVLMATESKGKTVIPKTPAARKRKRNVTKENVDTTIDIMQVTVPEEKTAKRQKADVKVQKSPVQELKISAARESNTPQAEAEKIEEGATDKGKWPFRQSSRIANSPAAKMRTPRIQELKCSKENRTPPAKAVATPEEAAGRNWPLRQSTRIANSPAAKSVEAFHSGLSRQASYNNTDSLIGATAFEPKRDSAVKVVKHAWSATGKTLSARAARIPYTSSPSMDNRTKVLQLKNLSSSKTCGRSTFLKSASPHIPSKLMYPPSEFVTGNIATGVSSFISRVQPARPSKKETEERRLLELERRKEKEEETRRKKDEMLKVRTDEKKRKNEERMKRVLEARENKERLLNEARIAQQRERKQREEEKNKEELERRRKEEEKLKEEKERKKKLYIAKKEEEEVTRLLRLKEQKERETRLETLRKEEEMKQLQEKKLFEEQKRIFYMQEKKLLEQQKRLQEQKLEAQRIEKEKFEEERREYAKRKAAEEEKRIAKEKQSLKPGNADATFTKDSPNVVASYEMTPAPKKDSSNYDIDDCRSDDSTDDDTDPKKVIPPWARGPQLKKALFDQEYFTEDADRLFPGDQLLMPPNLDHMFYQKRSRFYTRTSSAMWNTPPLAKKA